MNSNQFKIISALDFKKRFGELTDQVLYGGTKYKVSKNGNKFFAIVPFDQVINGKTENDGDVMQKFETIRKKINKKAGRINGMSWSRFIIADRKKR